MDDREQIRERELKRRDEGRKLYSGEDGAPRFRPSVAAYLDILGTKEIVPAMTNADLKAQVELLDTLNESLHDPAWEVNVQRMLTFSDSIALTVPIRDNSDAESELGLLADSIGLYQFELAREGRFLRGGLAIGPMYADYSHITGPALIEAVLLEQNKAEDGGAVFPRVLVNHKTLAGAGVDVDHLSVHSQEAWNGNLMVDGDDGEAFVNYLSTVIDEATEYQDIMVAIELLEQHRDAVMTALSTHEEASRVRDKYVWVAQYHNAFCSIHFSDFIDTLQILEPHLTASEAAASHRFTPLFLIDGARESA